jgi:hypothetical protein
VTDIGTDDIDHAPTPHDLAVLADLLDRRTYLHDGFLSAPRLDPRRLAFFNKPG